LASAEPARARAPVRSALAAPSSAAVAAGHAPPASLGPPPTRAAVGPVLPPGAPGKVGELYLELAPRAGRTRVVAQRQRVPLHVGRALHPLPDWPELAHLMVVMPTGGFVQGDAVRMEVVARAGARAHVTSQSATRAYRCPGAPIRQALRLVAEGDALLEWWPDPLIPFADTEIEQELELVVGPGATLLVADGWLAGRVARDEVHAYRRLALATVARRPDGALLFRDTLRLEPATLAPDALGMLGDARAVLALYLLGPDLASRLEAPLARLLRERAGDRAAVSRLPGDLGLVVRLLAESSERLRGVQRETLALARSVLFGRGAWALDNR
jgi:urease accessory protein